MKADVAKLVRAIEEIDVEGICNSPQRRKVISDAIAAIQKDGKTAMCKRYKGVKNYAGFGDQREDHDYGMGPAHGYIVFRVGRTGRGRNGEVELGADHIFFLEAARDYPGITFGLDKYSKPKKIGLSQTIKAMLTAEGNVQKLKEALDFEVDTHTEEDANE